MINYSGDIVLYITLRNSFLCALETPTKIYLFHLVNFYIRLCPDPINVNFDYELKTVRIDFVTEIQKYKILGRISTHVHIVFLLYFYTLNVHVITNKNIL